MHRALSLLRAFSDEEPFWTMTELAEFGELTKPTAHRLLGALERDGFLSRRKGDNRYQLGPALIVLGAMALRTIDLRAIARPEIKALAELTGEDVTLEVLMNQEVLVVDEVRGQGLWNIGKTIGTHWPLHASATGKVLLAFSMDVSMDDLGELYPVTDHTLVSWDDLTDAVEETRERGYGTNIEELERGFTAISAPVFNQEGVAIAALSVEGSVHRVDRERIPELAELLCQAASRVSRSLGHNGEKRAGLVGMARGFS